MTNQALAPYREKVVEAAGFLSHRVRTHPSIGLITGTGLGNSAGFIETEFEADYSELPHFPAPTAETHEGRVVLGQYKGRGIVALRGRFHLYEGYSPLETTFPVRVLQAMGVKTLFLLNASGGINPDYSDGDIMIVKDHINLTGENPLVGQNNDKDGPRFPDMTFVYDPNLAALARRAATRASTPFQYGVYAGLKGPSLETPAEIRYLRTIGADAVGFSTVMEVIAARHAGMRVLCLSVVTNVHNPDRPFVQSVEKILVAAAFASPLAGEILASVIEGLE